MAECELCEKLSDRVRSSVSDTWVHPVPHGHAVCTRGEESPAETALRSLASYVGSGGYNAPTVDAAIFEAKIRDGIDGLTAPLESRLTTLQSRITELERQVSDRDKLLAVAKHPFCPCVEDAKCGRRHCAHSTPISSYSCQWCIEKWQDELERLAAKTSIK